MNNPKYLKSMKLISETTLNYSCITNCYFVRSEKNGKILYILSPVKFVLRTQLNEIETFSKNFINIV